MRIDFDAMGDVHKSFEQRETKRSLMPGIPILARLDGRSFSRFTKGLQRPYDKSMSICMQLVAMDLLRMFNPTLAYTQSDEITLCWLNDDSDVESKILFSGKYQKLCSVLSSRASVKFNKVVSMYLPEKASEAPTFDCRIWQVPSERLAAENFLWRELDATRNSITMAASAYYPHSQLQKVNNEVKKEMLLWKNVNWNDYPDFFKKGSYFHKEMVPEQLTQEALSRIPEDKRPDVGATFDRSKVVEMKIPKLTSITNYADVLLRGAQPILETQA